MKAKVGAEIDQLENLVDELVKRKPHEDRIKAYMQRAGLVYTTDTVERLNSVLQALEGVVAAQNRGPGTDRNGDGNEKDAIA